LATLTLEQANELVVENQGWSESIAKAVARSWNLDWRGDGLDGAAFEALVFCSRRFDPERGVPFRGYAGRRIHEASTEAARKSKGWRKSTAAHSGSEHIAREVSADLFAIFPELRSGFLPYDESEVDGDQATRHAIQQLLMGASILAARYGASSPDLDDLVDYKRVVGMLAKLAPIHQSLMWKIYWEGISLRGVAEEWKIDELNVIREHKVLLQHLQKTMARGAQAKLPRVRPGLRDIAHKLRRKDPEGVFYGFLKSG
jgi:DNA-directed RNA polymerase specialized sigma subunit